jgi:hypothetical protein
LSVKDCIEAVASMSEMPEVVESLMVSCINPYFLSSNNLFAFLSTSTFAIPARSTTNKSYHRSLPTCSPTPKQPTSSSPPSRNPTKPTCGSPPRAPCRTSLSHT